MKIKSLQLNNFKCFENRLFNFTSRIEVTGRNGSGKSTIAEAIVFVLYNRTLQGSKDTDTYIMKDKDMCEVVINTDKGVIRRKRGKQSKLWINDIEITQENLEQELNLPDFDVFNSVFNVGYFMTMDESIQRQIILDLTERVDMVKLFKKLGGTEGQIEKWNINFEDLDGNYKEVNKQKLICQKEIDKIKVENDIYVKELSSISIKDISHLRDYQEKLKEKLGACVIDEELFDKYLQEERRYEDFSETIKQKEELKKWLEKNPIKAVPKTQSLIKEKDDLLRQCVNIPNGLKCPTCNQKIDATYKKKIEDSNELIDKRLEQIEKTFQETKEIEDYNRVVFLKQEKFDSIVVPSDVIKPQKKPKGGDELDLEIARINVELERVVTEINEVSNNIIRKNDLENKIEKNKQTLILLENNLIELKKLVEILSPKGLPNEEMNIKLQPLKDRIQKEVKGIDIVLLELLKSEMGYRKVWKILVNGIEYKRLSTGEKKQIDVSLSLILNDMLGEKFQNSIDVFFIDNMESLSQIINFNDNQIQLFLSEVSEEDFLVKNL